MCGRHCRDGDGKGSGRGLVASVVTLVLAVIMVVVECCGGGFFFFIVHY